MAFQPHSFMFQPLDDDDHDHTNMVSSSNPNTNNSILCHGGSGGQYSPFTMMKRSMSFSDHHQLQGGGDEDFSDEGSQLGEKKKRLNVDQVKTLEKSFEIGNKLEPERKLQLANALGLQPRQVAIWFQNRRARWKTKQLEKDYDVLSKQLDLLKADNQSLQAQNKKLHAQLSALKGRDSSETGQENQMKLDKGDQGSWSNGSDQNSSDINLDISRNTQVVMNNNNNNNTTSNNSSSSSQLVQGKNLFPSNLRPSSITQLLQATSRSDLHGLKVDHPHHQMLQQQSDHENFCSLFVNNNNNNNNANNHHGSTPAAVDQADHHQGTGFWPWPPEQHYFH